MAKEILQQIIQSFSPEEFAQFFRVKNSLFKPALVRLPEYEDENFHHSLYIGEIPFDEVTKLVIYAFKVSRELTERSGKKAQYEKGKKILKTTHADAGIFIFYDENNRFRFSFINTIYKGPRREWSYFKRYTYFVSPEETNKTFLLRIGNGDFSSLETIKEAFSVEKVTEEFYEAYRYALKEVIIKSLPEDYPYQKRHSFAQLLLSRIMFLYFLQRKGWFKWKDYKQDIRYIKNLWLRYKDWKRKTNSKDCFYSKWLSSLFFGVFNRKPHLISTELPEDIKESFKLMPYLNGGLFSKTELDELGFDVPDWAMEWLFEPDEKDKKKGFLETFNFTIDESSPDDVEVAVDPEMLGRVYESLIAEEERGEAGIFYTPRVEIDFMCKLSLIEYLANETQLNKGKIIEFVIDPHNKVSLFTKDELAQLKEKLNSVKIVDPAVGSGSFLVGMMNILIDLHQEITRAIENREENFFALKQKIILENLYGVDVKDWAVMVGELRLWLSLIIETDEKYMDIYTKPLLPNLSFKIRQGDSLIQEIAGVQINLKSEMLNVPKPIRDKIVELVERKRKFFSGLISADLKELKEIENFEQEIFKEIIQSKIDEVKKTIQSYENQLRLLRSQRDLYGSERTEKEQIKKIEALIEKEKTKLKNYNSLLSKIGRKTQKDYFLWELDFVEVFSQNGGFDIVIGNPPYVRQELIAPPLENKNKYSEEEWRKIKKEYKEKLIQSVKSVWNNITKIDKKSDLYVYFYYQGLSLLRPGGIFCFINSNSWLDVGYGAGLQEFLLKNMRPIYVFDNLAKRSFKQADVNTVIVLIQRPENKLDDYTVKFVAFKKPFEDVLNAEVIKKIESANQPVFDDENFRIYSKTKKELLLEGVEVPEEQIEFEPEHLPYIGNKWGGKYLRAPEIYFKILEKGKGKLVRLRDIAEVRFGIKTGANEFFYLKPVGKTVKEVVEIAENNPDALIRVKNGAGWEGEIEARFLKPVIKSLKEIESIVVDVSKLQFCIFYTRRKISVKERAYNFVEFGEKKGYSKKPTCSNRSYWYILPEISGELLFNMSSGDRYFLPLNNQKFFIDARLYAIKVRESINLLNLCVVLNNSFLPIYWEVAGRVMTGSLPLLDLKVYELKDTWIVNPNILDNKECEKAVEVISKRPIHSIFTELGFDPKKPIREQEPNPLPDRKALDDIIFDALGLTEEERKEVYWAVAELVKTRLEKARSV